MPLQLPFKLRSVLIGHSIPRRLNNRIRQNDSTPEEFLGVSNYFQCIRVLGVPGARLEDKEQMQEFFEAATCGHYDITVIDLGCNDIAAGLSPLRVLTMMMELAQSLVAAGQKVIIMSMLPRSRKKFYFHDKSILSEITCYNIILSKCCHGETNIKFFNQSGFNGHPLEETTIDGIHPRIHTGSPYLRNMRRLYFKALSIFDHLRETSSNRESQQRGQQYSTNRPGRLARYNR